MARKKNRSADPLADAFMAGAIPTPEAFSHLIDEAWKAREIIDRDGAPSAGMTYDEEGKLALMTRPSGGLETSSGALAVVLKLEGGLDFGDEGRLALESDRAVQFEDFFRLSRAERIEISELIALSTAMEIRFTPTQTAIGGNKFGYSVFFNMTGDCFALREQSHSSGKPAVHVYMRQGALWHNSPTATLLLPESIPTNLAAESLSLNAAGDHLAVGGGGKVHMYQRAGTTWTEDPIATLSTPPGDHSRFSDTCNLNAAGDYLAVGGGGKVHMYQRAGTTWTEDPIATLSMQSSTRFGNQISLSAMGNYFVTGDYGPNPGEIYIYQRLADTWPDAPTVTLSMPSDSPSNFFGTSIKLNAAGDCLAVVALDQFGQNGKVYVYQRLADTWTENPIATLSMPPGSPLSFGFSVDLNAAGDYLAVAALGENTSVSGKVYVYHRMADIWTATPIATLSASANRTFGYSFGFSGTQKILIIGAYDEAVGEVTSAGAAYLVSF